MIVSPTPPPHSRRGVCDYSVHGRDDATVCVVNVTGLNKPEIDIHLDDMDFDGPLPEVIERVTSLLTLLAWIQDGGR